MSTSPKPQAPVANKTRKPRSPAAPSSSLRDCVSDAQKLYQTYGRGEFSAAELASTFGISATSGPTAARVFTLKEFGLISKNGASFKVTEESVNFKAAQSGKPEFKRLAYAAILHSDFFRDLLTTFNSRLPPNAALVTRLEGALKFNAERAKAIAEVLEDSLKFACVVDGNGNIIVPRQDEVKQPDAEDDNDDDDESAAEQASSKGGGKEKVPTLPGSLRIEIPVKDGRRVIVLYPPDLTAEEATKIGTVLGAIVT